MEYVKRNALVIVLLALTGWNTMQIDEVRGVAYKTLGETYTIQMKQLVVHPELAK